MQWRTAGVCPLDFWLSFLKRIDSPLATVEAWAAAGNHSRFLLAVAIGESTAGTHFNRNQPENKNALNLRPPLRPDGTREPGSYMRFDRWEDGIQAARERITSLTYGNGIYAETVTILEFTRVWAPANDENNPVAFAAVIEQQIRSYPEESPMAELTYGRVPKPPIIDMIVQKPPYNAGYTLVAPRRVLGVCRHITDGLASLEWYRDFFGPGGQRYYDALTDFGIDQQGRIAMWNDPFGTRAPWASGGSDGLEGDGPLFVRTLGIGMINAGLASVEHVQKAPGKLTEAQMEQSARLEAWFFDGASNHPRGSKVPWHKFPLNPNVGCVTDMEHWEFATKSCPAAGIISQRDAIQNRIRAIMKKGQEGESQGEIPPPEPIEQDHGRFPEGMDEPLAAQAFGTAKLYRPRKRVSGFGFHIGHAVCEAWLERGSKEQTFPAAEAWHVYEDAPGKTRQYVSFVNGWILWRANAREGWRWIG